MSIKRKGGLFSFFKKDSPAEREDPPERFYYEQIATSVGAGGWTIDFINKKSYFDKQLRTILETPAGYEPSLKNALHFFDKDFHKIVIEEFENSKKRKSGEYEVKMVSYKGNLFWARVIAKPILDSRKKIVGVRGIIVNIDEEKKKEIALQNSISTIESNNTRLFKFANYVSHNLKLHINNLELTSQLFDDNKLSQDEKDLLYNYKETTKGLASTVSQLNEVVSIQEKARGKRVMTNLEETLEKAKNNLQSLIDSNGAYVYSDFSEAPEVLYIPDFMDNIMTILIKRGIKNFHPDRKPEVKVYSLEDNAKISIIIEDNGKGIVDDDDEHVYYNPRKAEQNGRSESVGFFIVKNQIEALGGTIEAIGKPGYGSKFIIKPM